MNQDNDLVQDYLLSIKKIQDENSQIITNRISFSYAKILPDFLEKNELIENSGPVEISDNSISRTSLAHKAMFDLCDGSKSIKIFAKGLHKNIYSSDFVIESFKRFVVRFVAKKDKTTDIPMILIVKEYNEKCKDNISKSNFVKEALNLKKKYSRDILKILMVEDPKKEIEVNVFDVNDKNITPKQAKGKYKSADICSFSIFGDFYSFRQTNKSGHKAYINLKDTLGIKTFNENFNTLNNLSKAV